MREGNELYRELFENARDMIYTHDLDGRFLSFNAAGERLTGYGPDELIEMNSAAVFGPEYQREIRRLIVEAMSSPSSIVKEWEIITKGGERRPVEASVQSFC